jgi:hypothetical protein
LTREEADVEYCGIDLHSNNSVVMISDENDYRRVEKHDCHRMAGTERIADRLGQQVERQFRPNCRLSAFYWFSAEAVRWTGLNNRQVSDGQRTLHFCGVEDQLFDPANAYCRPTADIGDCLRQRP